MKKEKEEYFIKIKDPKETRKEILECTRDSLKILQGYEAFKETRRRRTLLIESLRREVAYLKSLMIDLKSNLPKTNVVSKKAVGIREEIPKQPAEVKKIEQELAEIESKLGELQ